VRTTTEIWPAENTWTPDRLSETEALMVVTKPGERSQRDRYWIDPQLLLKAQRYCSDRGLSIIGVYHSHPDYPATPSECDRALAWPEYSYLIISVQQGVAHESRSWCLDADHQFVSEALLICD
jgi:proteasome lid subunit RPN8/RPN11